MKLLPSLLAGTLLPLAAVPAFAQDGSYSSAVVQPLPPPAVEELKIALGQLARNTQNLDALLAAGTASLELNDVDAAIGFFGRAEALAPNDPRIKAGKAAAYVRTRRPDEALVLFQQAEAEGVQIVKLAGDYGLAWDLVGNNREAQIRYRRALAAAPDNDEVIRRLALSQAIAGDQQGFEATLRPLLEKRDFGAYRTRAFGLAILGKADDAVAITEAVMDRPMASKLEPYLRFMPQLTKAQQAAAANLGIYPTATRIGRDDPRIAALSGSPSGRATRVADAAPTPAAPPPAAPVAAADGKPRDAGEGVVVGSREEAERAVRVARREVAGDPLSRTSARPRIVERAKEEKPEETSPPATPPVATVARAVPAATPAAQPKASPSSGTMRLPEATGAGELAPAAQAAPATVARMEQGNAAPGFDLGKVGGSSPASSGPQAMPAVAQPAAQPAVRTAALPSPTPPAVEAASVADAFADLAPPKPKAAAAPSAGAVDITSIKVRREVEKKEPEAKPEPAKPVQPSRYWVQVATGKDKSALKFDWRRLSKQADGLLDGKGPFVTEWGQTNRLLAGPYKTRDEARKALKELQEKGFDAFTFTSPEGQDVAQLR